MHRVILGDIMASLEDIKSKISRQEVIAIHDSIDALLAGNREVAKVLRQKKAQFSAPGEYDAVMIACSDARCEITILEDYLTNKLLVLQFAGNVVNEDMEDAFACVRQKGEIIDCGHINCGACDAKSHEDHYKGISPSIDKLLTNVEIAKKSPYAKDIFTANAINQSEKMKHLEAVREKGVVYTPVLFDFVTANEPFKFLKDGAASTVVSKLKSNSARMLARTKNENKSLATQYAHAIVVSDPIDLGVVTNSRVLFDAGLNELFCVSANGDTISTNTIASIEYALLKISGVKDFGHIVILHSHDAIAKKLKQEVLASKIIREKTQNGVTITLMNFNKATCEAKLS